MSFILDALRRAEAERQRGGVPGLHDQTGGHAPPAAVSAGQVAERRGQRLVLWAAAVVLLGTALAGAWWLGRGGAQPVATAAAVAPVVLPAVAAVVPAVVPTVLPAVAPPATTPVLVLPPAPAAPAVAQAQRPAQPPPAMAPRPARSAVAPVQPRAPVSTPRTGTVAAAAAADPDPIRAWASLPAATRSALPPLAWSGLVHAARADQRLVIVNGQVAREGDPLGAGLQLLQIRPKSVVLRWQGQRIEVPL